LRLLPFESFLIPNVFGVGALSFKAPHYPVRDMGREGEGGGVKTRVNKGVAGSAQAKTGNGGGGGLHQNDVGIASCVLLCR
jgi:hypothetical protein